jgi:chitin disaccharide deacetylase
VKRLIVTADDFGLDPAVNEAVEKAHRHGILTSASLMVGAPAAADAAARARRLPGLAVGLHLVLVDGRPVSPAEEIPDLVGPDGAFARNMLRASLRYFGSPQARRQLAREIRAQFEAYAATGLALDHIDVHKHLHVHPTVARLLLDIGCEFGMRAVRLPLEPRLPLRRAFPEERLRPVLYRPWVMLLRHRLRAAGIATTDHVFGLAWSGRMVEERVLRLLPCLPEGLSELYFHPAVARTPALAAAMPTYRHEGELAALLSPAVRSRIAECGITLHSCHELSQGRIR